MKHRQQDQARDPICGMKVDIDPHAFQSRYQEQTYYFCASSCKEEFDADPARFAAAAASPATFTKAAGMVAPHFGAAGSGGAEYEPGPR